MNTQRVEIAHEVGTYFIETLLKADNGRTRSKHKSAVQELRQIMTNFELQAENNGYSLGREIGTGIMEAVILVCFFAVMVSALVIAAAKIGAL